MNDISNVIIEKSKDDYLVVKIKIDDKFKYIGSKYNMKSQIDKFINSIKGLSSDTVFTIFGLGSGEHIRALRKLYPNSYIFIFEPNEYLFNCYKTEKEFEWIHKDKEIMVLKYSAAEFLYAMRTYVSDERLSKIKIYSCFNYEVLYQKEYLEFVKCFKNISLQKVITINTKLKFSTAWFENLLKNIKSIYNSEVVNDFKDKYKNKPAIIVSAGPSLNGNLEYIKNLKDEMFIFCGGRNLKAFEAEKINPHLIGIIDPGQISYDIVKDYIEDCKAPLLFYEGTNADAVAKHKNKKILYTQSNLIRNIFEENITNMGVGGSIAHVITKFAAEAGCNPIIFIGQDLAFSNNKMHAESTKTKSSNIDFDKRDLVEVQKYGGVGTVKTDRALDLYRNQMEDLIREYPDTTFINASVGGSRIQGTLEMTLEEAISKYKDKVEDIAVNIDEKRSLELKEKFNRVLQDSINNTKEIIKLSKNGLKETKSLKKYYLYNNTSQYNKSCDKINEIDQQLSDIYNNNEFFQSILYAIFLWAGSQKYGNESDYKSRLDYINFIKNNKDILYNQLIEKSDYMIEKFEETLADL